MGAENAVITIVIGFVAALAGIAIMGSLISTYGLPEGPLRPGAVALLDGWSTALVLAVGVLGGLGFVIIAMLARLR